MKKILFGMLLSLSIFVQVFAQDEAQLEKAIQEGNVEQVKQLLQETTISMKEKGATLIAHVIWKIYPSLTDEDEKAYKDIIKLLLTAGANINGKIENPLLDKDAVFKDTPLKAAINQAAPEIVKFLIEQGADVNKQFNNQDLTPLQWAAVSTCPWFVTKYESRTELNISPIQEENLKSMKVFQNNFYEIMRILIEHGAQKNSSVSYVKLDHSGNKKLITKTIQDELLDCQKRALHPEEIQRFIDLLKE